jgi:hypothetical protein
MMLSVGEGVLVEHASWGRGKVVEVFPPYFVAHFPSLNGSEGGPRRKLRLNATQISISLEQSDPVLDGLDLRAKPAKSGKGGKRATVPKPTVHSLEQAIDWFEKNYPGRFSDTKLVETELRDKRDAHQAFMNHFGEGRGQALLDANDVSTISKGLSELYHATNIPARFEVMAATDGLKDGAAAARLLKAVLDVIAAPDATSFAALVDAVSKLPSPAGGSKVLTWPNVTILPFLAAPSTFMVLKPAITKKMARRVGFDLMYSSPPAWHTYDALLRMSAMLLERLAPIGARDLIDVQSFMWVTQDLD